MHFLSFPFGTTGMGFTPIGVRPDHVITIRFSISEHLVQEMGRGWEWTDEIGEKSMQIISKVPSLTFWYFWQ